MELEEEADEWALGRKNMVLHTEVDTEEGAKEREVAKE
jgi:hypothetical protein